MKRTVSVLLVLFLMAALVGCSSSITPGKAQLPAGIEEAKVPGVEQIAYLYVSSEPPLALATKLFQTGRASGKPLSSVPSRVELQRATVVAGTTLGEFAGTLEFESEQDADVAWSLFRERVAPEEVWGKPASPQIHLVRGVGPWADSAREGLNYGQLVPLPEQDPQAWALITNLPQDPPSRPIAVGVMTLDGDFVESLGEVAGVALAEVENALRAVRVNALAFGMYMDSPVDVSESVDLELLKQSRAGVLFVSHSSYPGFLVSFILSVVAGRTGLETVDLADTNARYRTIGDLHLIVKNRGSLVYAALATTRADAERLILSIFGN